MKIAINGEIVDTEHIFKIGSIISDNRGHINHYFTIFFFSDKKLSVKIPSNCYWNGDDYGDILTRKLSYEEQKRITLQFLKETSEYQNSLKLITDFRESIVKIWSENQPTILQFNLEI